MSGSIICLALQTPHERDPLPGDQRRDCSIKMPANLNQSAHLVSDGQTSRLVAEARDWALCRARRLRLEEQLALQQEFRLLDDDESTTLREELSRIETRFGEVPTEQVLDDLNGVQRRLYGNDEESYWS